MFYSFFFFVCPKDISFLAGAKRATRYEQVASLRASSPFVGYCEKKTREGHARGDAKAWGGVEKGELAMIALLSSAPRSFARQLACSRAAGFARPNQELARRLASCHLALLSQPGI